MTSGVYCITCTATGDRYVGRSKRIEQRWKEHKRALRSGRHDNQALSEAWEAHGESAFDFEVLEVCANRSTDLELENVERKWVLSLNPSYNNDPWRTERSEYMSELMKQRWAEKRRKQLGS